MKIRIIPILLSSLFILSACGGNEPEPEAEGDGYVDVLPDKIEEGMIFHAFNWTYKQILENLDSIRDAGFRSIQTNPVQQPKSNGTKWEFFYQPVSFSIAKTSPLGTKDDLIALTRAAKERGMSIIADIVFNHMATPGMNESSKVPPIDPEIEEYEPYIYQHENECFHRVDTSYGSGNVTQLYPGLPDLNTANEHVQERALSLLKECIDAGIDGFRFDAAKHIETPEDPNFASSFWDNTLEKAKEYYKTQNNGKELFAYGEILNDPDGGRDISLYTKYMKVTDNTYISGVNNYFNTKKVDRALDATYGKTTDASNLITWVESHDTYTGGGSHIGDKKTIREWSLIASRKDTISLYFARVDDNETVAKVASYVYEDPHIAYANRFHNRYIHIPEYQSSVTTQIYLNERVSDNLSGAFLVNPNSTPETVEVNFPHLPDGYYFDQVQAKQVHVKNHKAKIEFDDFGIVYLTPSKNGLLPVYTPSNRTGGYIEPFTLNVELKNVTDSYYQLNNGEKVPFTDKFSKKIGETAKDGELTSVTIGFKNNGKESTRSLNFTKVDLLAGGFNIIHFNPEYVSTYEIYIWTWTSSSSVWTKDYEFNSEKNVLLIKNYENLTGFIVALFAKGYVISDLTEWDSRCIKQTADIHPSDIYFDASLF